MHSDLTVIYYSSNREDPAFERRIQTSLINAVRETPIISGTQRPTAFGQNICVGDVGRSGHNVFRQYQIGVEQARTRYVAPAESDALYPAAWFRFRPASDVVLYRAVPIYLCFLSGYWSGFFWPKNHWEGATMVSREYLPPALLAMGVWQRRRTAGFWSAVLALFWFSHGVMVAWSRPPERGFALAALALAVVVVFAASLPALPGRFCRKAQGLWPAECCHAPAPPGGPAPGL